MFIAVVVSGVALSACGEEDSCWADPPDSEAVSVGTTETVLLDFPRAGPPKFLDFAGHYWSVENDTPPGIVPDGGGAVQVQVTLVKGGLPGEGEIEVGFPDGESTRLTANENLIGCA